MQVLCLRRRVSACGRSVTTLDAVCLHGFTLRSIIYAVYRNGLSRTLAGVFYRSLYSLFDGHILADTVADTVIKQIRWDTDCFGQLSVTPILFSVILISFQLKLLACSGTTLSMLCHSQVSATGKIIFFQDRQIVQICLLALDNSVPDKTRIR